MKKPLLRALGLALVLTLATGGAPGAREPMRARPLLVAFYVPWEPPALASLKQNVGAMDVFAPMWASLVSRKGEVRWESDPEAHAVLAKSPRRPRVFPIVSNAHDDVWDAAAAEAVILEPAAGEAFAKALAQSAQAEDFGGFVMDFENLSPKAAAAYPGFLARLRDSLHKTGREVWVTTTLSSQDGVAPLATDVDAVVLMAYDQCWATSRPGPIAADAWIEANLATRLAQADPRRYIVALASYAYDWPQGRKAEVLSVGDAVQLAARTGQQVETSPNPHFSYQAKNGARHEVWWLDGADFARQRALVERRGVRGVALWRMGLEDPGLWAPQKSARPTAPGPTATCEPLGQH